MNSFSDELRRIDDAMDVEDLAEARRILSAVEAHTPTEQWERDTYRLMITRPQDVDRQWARPLDEIGLALKAAAADERAHGITRERAFLSSQFADLARRRHAYVLDQLDAWEHGHGASARVVAMRGRVLMLMDAPERARDVLTAAVGQYTSQHVEYELATVFYQVAEFAQAESLARDLGAGRFRVAAASLRAAIAASVGDLQAEYDALSLSLDLAPNSDERPGRLLRRAMAAAALDRLDDARTDLHAALAAVPERYRPEAARFIRHRLDALDAAGPDTRRARLQAFPTIVQKWNYCGPAVIELCLRYAGIEMTQDIIAQAVKRPSGTPMVKIVEFLKDQGFEVRRVEATVERLRAAIDLGVPVILESANGNSAHVNVAIGYDDRVGVLVLADPITHAPIVEGVEARREFSKSLRYGGVAVLGRAQDVQQATRDALDAAGLVQSSAISRFDDVGREFSDFSPAFDRVTPLEAAGIAQDALAIEPDYEEASVALASSLQGAVTDMASHAAAGLAITATRSRFPGNADAALLASLWHESAGSQAFALADAVVGSELGPETAGPRQAAARLLSDVGERALSYFYANAAFLRAPHEPNPTLHLATLTMRERLERAVVKGMLGSFAAAVDAGDRDSTTTWDIDDDVLEPLTRALADAALDMAPDNPTGSLIRGDDAALVGDWPTATGEYRIALSKAEEWFVPRLRLAFALEGVDDTEALVHLRELIAQAGLPPASWRAVIALAGRLKDPDLARAAAEAAIDVLNEPSAPIAALFDAVRSATGSELQAARAIDELAASRPTDSALLHAVVDLLTEAHLAGRAVTILRRYLADTPDDAGAQFSLARALARTPACRAEAIELLERARELVPSAAIITVELGWLLRHQDPLRVRAMLASLDRWDLGATALAREVATHVGAEVDVDAVDARLADMCGSPFHVALNVAEYHFAFGRIEEGMAMELAGSPNPDDLEGALRYVRVLCDAGRKTAALEFVAGREELQSHPQVALLLALSGPTTHAELVRTLAQCAARTVAMGPQGAMHAIEALCLEGRFDEAKARAGDDPWALARLAEWATDHETRLALAHHAFEVAPESPAVLAVWHAVLLEDGRVDEARRVAATLGEEFPFEHEAAERMAECELFTGDVDDAERFALTAVSEAPNCARAWATAALVSAVNSDWGTTAFRLEQSLEISRRLPGAVGAEPIDLVAATLHGEPDTFERCLAQVRRRSPGLPLDRLLAACEARLGV